MRDRPAANPLLLAKLLPPRPRAGDLPRSQLWLRLDNGPELLLLSAPAGYGKTALLSGWLQQQRQPVAWLAVDPEDNDPLRFLSYLIVSLDPLIPGMAAELCPLVDAGAVPPPPAVVALIANRLMHSAQQPVVLVLDQFHLVNSAAVHTLMHQLIERAAGLLRLIVATRTDPPWPLARWRVRGMLAEIRAEALRFAPAESAQLLAPFALTAAQLDAVEGQVAGWPAGLRLLRLALQTSNAPDELLARFNGRHQYVATYLLDELLAQQSVQMRAFLTQTAVLGRVCASLCEAAVVLPGAAPEASSSVVLLAQAEQGGLFLLPLDDEGVWFRYPPLIAEALASVLPAEERRAVHRRAAAWFAALPSDDEAIQHALLGEEQQLLAACIAAATRRAIGRGEAARIQGWLRLLPDAALLADPWLATVVAWNAVFAGRLAEAAQFAQAAAAITGVEAGWLTIVQAWLDLAGGDATQALARIEVAPPALAPGMFAWIAGRASLQLGQTTVAITAFHRAFQLASAAAIPLAISDIGDELCATLNAAGRRGDALLQNSAVRAQLLDDAGQPLAIAALSLCRTGMLAYEANELDDALQALRLGYRLADSIDHAQALVESQRFMAMVTAARGELPAALAMMQLLRLRVDADGDNAQRALVAVSEAQLALRADERSAASRWLAAPPPAAPEHRWLLAAQDIRAHLALGHDEAAGALLAAQEQAARQEQQWRAVLTLALLASLRYLLRGETAEAQRRLREAVGLAAPEGYLRAFLDEDPQLLALLPAVCDQAPAFVQRLIGPSGGSPAQPELLEPLREREREALRLIEAGLGNREIAARMVIELSTVKSHIKNIYAKLHVSSRTQAIAKARRLGLL